ncbi:MAG TPA: DUF4097 family beta strand repeat-containing protein [Terriglobales bacterium]|nr:DUF4097 family beta strand repeat-containing protein [Terriglobales bacterium]
MGRENQNRKLAWLLVAGWAGLTLAGAQTKELQYLAAPGASVSLTNDIGPVTVRYAEGHKIVVKSKANSNKVEVDAEQKGNRFEIRTHILQPGSEEEQKVEYEIFLPAKVGITVRANTGPIRVKGLRGSEVILEGDSSPVEVHEVDAGGQHLHVRTVSGTITLGNVSSAHLEVRSLSGDVSLENVSGPKVQVTTTQGDIRYQGEFGSNGEYSLISHSGDIDVALPEGASVDMMAESVEGSADNDFPLQRKQHSSFLPHKGRSFSGTSHSGSSSVQLSSFSGKIRVKKQ